jgi:hypothetical protein
MNAKAIEAALLLGSLKPGLYDLGDGVTFVLTKSGRRAWYLNGRRHRTDGPAIEEADGTRVWWTKGKRHREDGPDIEFSNGTQECWMNGKRVNE